MGKNSYMNKKRIAQQKQDYAESLVPAQEEKEREESPWAALRSEKTPEEPERTDRTEYGYSLKSKKYEKARQKAAAEREAALQLENEKARQRFLEGEKTSYDRKYMYDSSRSFEDIHSRKDEETEDKDTVKLTDISESRDTTQKEKQKAGTFYGINGQEDIARKTRKKRRRRRLAYVAAAIVLVLAVFGFKIMVSYGNPKYLYNYFNDASGSGKNETFPEHAEGADSLIAYCTQNTDPSHHMVTQEVSVNGNTVESFERDYPINFTADRAQPDVNGFITFRGNFTRSASSYGQAGLGDKCFDEDTWTYSTGKVLKNNGVDYWSGNGWTGQPLLMKWDDDVKQTMNLYDSAKQKEGLVEVIYPGMDGCIHFLDLDTGEETRPMIYVGMTFKGTATIYPDGTPLLFCGSGDAQTGPFGENVSQRFYIYSLINGKLLYEGGYDDDFAPRIWHAYDSSPIIDTWTDTLIQPGENGVIYTMRLNTHYDRESGALSVDPDEVVKFKFTIEGKYKEGGYLWGSECSGSVWGGYLYLGDNAGSIYCLDLNTMKMVWIQEVNEDINSSPILSEEEDGRFIYFGTTLKYNYDSHSMGEAAVYKLNAMNGEIVWKKPFGVHTVKGYAGGVLSTGSLLDTPDKDYVIYSVSKTPSLDGGYLVALDRATGHEEWKLSLDMYSWSSTVITTDYMGHPYIIQGCQNGDLLLIDALDGTILDSMNFGSAIEATPVMYANRIVLATRSEKILGVRVN